MQTALAEFSLLDLEHQLADWGFKSSHAGRILRAFYQTGGELDTATLRLPSRLAEKLRAEYSQCASAVAARQVAADATTKLLLQFEDGCTAESVLMPDFRPDRAAGCLSSQVGCAMGCDFCATAKDGFTRNLTTGEIIAQFLALRREARLSGRDLKTVVFMGMGEPMLNLDHVLGAVERIADNRVGALGWRQITISTVGIVPGIEALTATGLNLQLAVSLHAPDDATRSRFVPVARRFPIAEILAAAARFQAVRGRPVSIQYCLFEELNDSPDHAHALARLLAPFRMHVNLLRYNPTGFSFSGEVYRPSPDATAESFAGVLQSHGIVTHFRRSRGAEIEAACGQLRRPAEERLLTE